MDNSELYELEDLLKQISRYKRSKKEVARIQELLQPMFENQRAKDERLKYKLSTSYMNCDIEKDVSHSINALTRTKSLHKLAEEDLTRLNGEEQDILHALELTDLSLDELTQLTVELKQLRIERRVTKNFLEVSRPLSEFACDNERLIKQLQRIAGETRRITDSIEKRTYHVREKTSLQEAFDKAEHLSTRIT